MVNSAVLKAQLAKVPIDEKHGTEFYVHIFTMAPELKKPFKAEGMSNDDVLKSDRFKRQGQRVLTALNVLVEIAGNRPVFDAYMKDFMDKHKHFGHIDFAAFFPILYAYLEKHTGMSADEKAAWEDLTTNFFLPDIQKFATGWGFQ